MTFVIWIKQIQNVGFWNIVKKVFKTRPMFFWKNRHKNSKNWLYYIGEVVDSEYNYKIDASFGYLEYDGIPLYICTEKLFWYNFVPTKIQVYHTFSLKYINWWKQNLTNEKIKKEEDES